MAEMTKLLVCMVLVLLEEGTFLRFKASLHNAIIKNKVDTVSRHDSSKAAFLHLITFSLK